MNQTLLSACNLTDPKLKHVCEFGVFTGGTLAILAAMYSTIMDVKQIYGFDSFEGLPEDWADLKKGDFSTKGNVPVGVANLATKHPNITIFQGWFNQTIPLYKQIADPIALLHVDCDLYSSAKEVLFELNSFIVPNTIIVFDEWTYEPKPENGEYAEQKAFNEWVQTFSRKVGGFNPIEPQRQVFKVLI